MTVALNFLTVHFPRKSGLEETMFVKAPHKRIREDNQYQGWGEERSEGLGKNEKFPFVVKSCRQLLGLGVAARRESADP